MCVIHLPHQASYRDILEQMRRQTIAISYSSHPIPCEILFTSDDMSFNTILFLGSGQVDQIFHRVAQLCPPNIAVVQGAPHWIINENNANDFMAAFVKQTLDYLLAHVQIQQINIIAESQATPPTIFYCAQPEYLSRLRTLILIQPLGLTSNYYQRHQHIIKLFRRRMTKNMLHQLGSLLTDKYMRGNYRTVMKRVNLTNTTIQHQFAHGLSVNSFKELQQICHNNHHIVIISGKHDALFPPRLIQQNLAKYQLPIPVIRVSRAAHSSLATRQGYRLLKIALACQPRTIDIATANTPTN